nr:hypothetical protein [uncultured Psychroserpens sp.]
MKKISLTIISLITILFSYSQGITSIDIASERLIMSSDAKRTANAVGSPYINENFSPLRVKGYDNQLFTGRFNAYNGEFEVNIGTKIIALDKSKQYEVMFTQTNKIYRTYSYNTKSGISKKGFLTLVNETEKSALLKEEIIKYYELVPAATSYQQDKPAKFNREDDNYYLKIGDNITYFPTKKKDILKAFPKNAKAIKNYIKKNKLSTKEESDLIKIGDFISSL